MLHSCCTSLCDLTAALQQEGRETADHLQEPAGVLHSNHCGQCACNCGLCSAWELCFQMLDPANPVPDAARLFAAQTLCYKVRHIYTLPEALLRQQSVRALTRPQCVHQCCSCRATVTVQNLAGRYPRCRAERHRQNSWIRRYRHCCASPASTAASVGPCCHSAVWRSPLHSFVEGENHRRHCLR